ncbi:hypothetical protein Tco_0105975, partial [Tanacetum coccineum]
FEAVTFPSILLGNPPMKASRSFSVFGIMFGHKTANSWNLLIPSDLFGLFYSNRLGVSIPPGQGIIRVPVGPVFLLGLLVFAIVAACTSRAKVTLSATTSRGYGMIYNDEDGGNDAYDDDGDDDFIDGIQKALLVCLMMDLDIVDDCSRAEVEEDDRPHFLALAIPEQTATGKEISNPFMADWKPKNAKDDKVTKEFKIIKEQIKE